MVLSTASPNAGLFGKGTKFRPVIDGVVIPEDPAAAFAAGRFHHVPFLTGYNRNEATIFLRQLGVTNVSGYKLFLKVCFGDRSDEVLRMFPAADNEQVRPALEKVITLAWFGCPARFAARSAGEAGSPAFFYFFTKVPAMPVLEGLAAFHGSEIPSVFARTDTGLGAAMSSYWLNFARTGNPNGPGLPEWPKYTAANDLYLELGNNIKTGAHLNREACDLFEKIMHERREGHP